VVPAGPASAAAAGCTTSGSQVTCIFLYTGAAQTWTVPAGIPQATFTLYGAEGGANSALDAAAGLGAEVTATLPVTAGTMLQVNAGQAGAYNSGVPFGGGGVSGGDAGDGGGATDVRIPAADGTYPLASRLLVAGGGGGGAERGFSAPGSGGAGGNADSAGVTGGSVTADGTTLGGGGGGSAGTTSGGGAGGAGGTVTGTSTCPDGALPGSPGGGGSLGTGGGGGSGGGGGGGGYYGGGGGGGFAGGACAISGSGGGGGGASYTVPPGGTIIDGVAAPDDAPNGEVIITYTQPLTVTATTLTSSANPSMAGGPVTYTATVSPAPDGGTVAFTDDGPVITGCGARPVDTSTGTATCQVTYPDAGTHTIIAIYTGDASFGPSPSGPFTQQVQPMPQAITFTTTPPSPAKAGATYTPAATGGGSGNPVTFSIGPASTAGACSISSGGVVSFTAAGSCVIDANQAGNASYAPAPQVSQTVTVTVTVPGPAAHLADLRQDVRGIGLGHGQVLTATVVLAQRELAAGQRPAVCVTMTVFILEVQIQTPWAIRASKAKWLTQDARQIRAALGC
jgi:hypothetical protein